MNLNELFVLGMSLEKSRNLWEKLYVYPKELYVGTEGSQ